MSGRSTFHVPRSNDKNDATKTASRGKNIDWEEMERFDTIAAYKESPTYKDIVENFTCMRKRSPDYADTEHFVCKFARKVGYNPCPV